MRLVVVFTMSAVTIEIWPTEVPIWGLVLAIAIAIFYIVPAGMIQAITNQQIGLNVITELIAGYALPGKPIALMIFKTFGYIVRLSFALFSVQLTGILNHMVLLQAMAQALQFTSDMKLGHYMKIPPRSMFWCQIVATVVAGTTQLGVQQWYVSHLAKLNSIVRRSWQDVRPY